MSKRSETKVKVPEWEGCGYGPDYGRCDCKKCLDAINKQIAKKGKNTHD